MKYLIGLLFSLTLYSCSNERNPNSDTEKILMYSYAEDFVKKQLKSPSSAKFAEGIEKVNSVTYLQDGRYNIESWVESQNSFGAMLRTKFSCTLKREESTITLESINIE